MPRVFTARSPWPEWEHPWEREREEREEQARALSRSGSCSCQTSTARETLSYQIPLGCDPTREARIFHSGINTSTKGSWLFDAQAAAAVLAAQAEHGVDLLVDLEHKSVDGSDTDARGWARLEVRNGGELWARISWTSDGARRICERLQKYLSPAFDFDPKTRRVMRIASIAITSQPATHGAMPLGGAS